MSSNSRIRPFVMIFPGSGSYLPWQGAELTQMFDLYAEIGQQYSPRDNGFVFGTSGGSIIAYFAAKCGWDREIFITVCQKLNADQFVASRFGFPRTPKFELLGALTALLTLRSSIYKDVPPPAVTDGKIDFINDALQNVSGKDLLKAKVVSNEGMGFKFHFVLGTYDPQTDTRISHLIEPEIVDGKIQATNLYTRCPILWPSLGGGLFGRWFRFPRNSNGDRSIDISMNFTETMERIEASCSQPQVSPVYPLTYGRHYTTGISNEVKVDEAPRTLNLYDGGLGGVTSVNLLIEILTRFFMGYRWSSDWRQTYIDIPFHFDFFDRANMTTTPANMYEFGIESVIFNLINTITDIYTNAIHQERTITTLCYDDIVRKIVNCGGNYLNDKNEAFEFLADDVIDRGTEYPLIFTAYKRSGMAKHHSEPPIQTNYSDDRPETTLDGLIPLLSRWERFDAFLQNQASKADLIIFHPQFYSLTRDPIVVNGKRISSSFQSFRDIFRQSRLKDVLNPGKWKCVASKLELFPAEEESKGYIEFCNFDGFDVDYTHYKLGCRYEFVLMRSE